MGEMEHKHADRARRENIKRIALGTVQTAGILALAIAVPNAIQGFYKLGLLPGSRPSESIRRSYLRLIKSGHLKRERNGVSLTAKGERELRRLQLRTPSMRPRKWDGKWRVVAFDIPERKKGFRNKVRLMIREIGFVRLQDSVWVYPFDCEDLITLLKADLRIGREILYMIVDQLEGDARLRQEFDVS